MKTMKSTRLLAGLGLIAVSLFTGRDAQAIGIIITGSGGIIVGSDPIYDYSFDVYLLGGTTFLSGATFTIDGLVGIAAEDAPTIEAPTTSQPMGPGAGDRYTFVGGVSLETSTNPYTSNVTWENVGISIVNNTDSDLFIGEFTVDGNVNVAAPQTTMAVYTAANPPPDNPPLTGGVVIIPEDGTAPSMPQVPSVPEPSSIILMVTGVPLLLVLVICQRRRLSARRIAA